MNKKITLFLGLLMVSSLSYADLKIGVVNIQAVMEKSPQVEKAQKSLEQEFKPKGDRLAAEQRKIQELEEKLTKDRTIMSESQRLKLESELKDKVRDFRKEQSNLNEDLNKRRNDELSKLQRRLVEAARTVAKDQDFDLILYKDTVIYSDEQLDITNLLQQKISSMPE